MLLIRGGESAQERPAARRGVTEIRALWWR
jgi:hypothetical protein